MVGLTTLKLTTTASAFSGMSQSARLAPSDADRLLPRTKAYIPVCPIRGVLGTRVSMKRHGCTG